MPPKPVHRALSLRFIWSATTLLVAGVLAILFIGLMGTLHAADVMSATDARLLMAAEMAREIVGPDYHDRITGPDSVSPEAFDRIVRRNDDLCRRLGLQYLWSVLQVDDRLVFTTATHSDVNDPASPSAAFFETHRDPAAFAAALGPEQKPAFSTFNNEWGQGRMVLAPRRDALGRTYIFGASVSLRAYNAVLQQTALAMLGVGLLALALASLAARGLARRLATPVDQLTQAADRMAAGDLEAPLPLPDIRELQSLSRSLDRMRQGLRQDIEALRESEERFRRLAEDTPLYICSFLPGGTLTYVNPMLAKMTGLAPAALLGVNFLEWLAPEERRKVEAALAALTPERPVETHEQRVQLAGNGERWQDWTNRAFFDANGRVTTFRAVGLDITERKRAEAALRDSEARLKSLYDNINEGVALHEIITDENNKPIDFIFLSANPTYEKLTGLRLADITGKRGREVIPNLEQRWIDAYGRVAQTGEPAIIVDHSDYLDKYWEVKAFSPRPNQFAVALTAITERKRSEAEVYAAHGELQRLLAESDRSRRVLLSLLEDQRAAEEQIRVLNRELEQRVQARTAELNAANAELSQANDALLRANRLKDEFLATMSHELRTPLSGVLGLSETLQLGIYGPLTAKQQQALSAIRDSGQHLLELITDILDFAKLEAGRVELALEPAPVDQICAASLQFIQPMAQAKNQKTGLTLDWRADTVRADGRRLKQMLTNLLNNAVKFTPRGGEIGLRVEADPARGEIHFAVWDTGIGISAEDQARLFQPFIQLDSRLARQYEGTGLGLALVRRMAELHGGRVTVHSEGVAGRGSTFTLTLPWQPPSPAPEAAPGVAAATGAVPLSRNGTGQLVLIVEDNEVNLVTLTDVLREQGYRVETARQGDEGLERARTLRPDLILLDIQLPGLDGLEVLRQLRASPDPQLAATPVIALTALVMPGDRERCLQAGANAYLGKPIGINTLTEAVDKLLAITA